MNLLQLLSWMSGIAVIIYQLLGIYVYRLNPKARVNRLFLILCHCFTIWSFAYVFVYLSKDLASYWIWLKISALGWCFFDAICLHLVLAFTNNGRYLDKKLSLPIIYFPSVLFYLIMLIIASNENAEWERVLEAVFTWYQLTMDAITIFIINRWSLQSKLKIEKMQAKVINNTIIAAVVIGLITENYFPVYVIGNEMDYSNLINLIVVIGIYYAMQRYGLFKMDSLIKAEDILNQITEMIIVVDMQGIIIKVNPCFEQITGYAQKDITGKNLAEFIDKSCGSVYPTNNQIVKEAAIITKWGEFIPLKVRASFIRDNDGDVLGYVLVGRDMRLIKQLHKEIEERKRKEAELEFISFHDPLTGLYNRNYFESEMQRLATAKHYPLGIIMADVDGLKFVNDTFGHDEGDALLLVAAKVLKDIAGKHGSVARIGGDEFAILLNNFDQNYIKVVEDHLCNALQHYNNSATLIPLSISIGIGVSFTEYKSITDLLKIADDNMYRVKLNQRQSTRSTMVKALLETLGARNVETEDHAERLRDLIIEFGKKVGLAQYEITELSLLAQFHDIGKVGISDKILLKPGALNNEERHEMNRHCEIGYRIAQSIPELLPIARLILLHHERWDGSGYPLGLPEEQIPLECRILAIVDAYDAMTNERPYRKPMSKQAAIDELIKNRGTQFDPSLISIFVDMLENH